MLVGTDQNNMIEQYSRNTSSEVQKRSLSTSINRSPETDKNTQQVDRKAQTLPGQKTTNPDGSHRDSLELTQEAQVIRELQLRDREVRAHEAAHAAAGGGLLLVLRPIRLNVVPTTRRMRLAVKLVSISRL